MTILDLQVFGGLALMLVVLWQLSTGMHWIKLGRKSVRIHRYTGITLAVLMVPHLINGMRIVGWLKF